MNIDILTLFPEMFDQVLNSSILGKAQKEEQVHIRRVNFRDYSENKHGSVDDYPYGGGGGMVLRPEPIFRAVESVTSPEKRARVILFTPQGETYNQQKAEALSREDHLVLICGHYEGYDERIRRHLVTDEISIGDYVLTGGELPAMVLIDSLVRLLPGVLGNEKSAEEDSFSTGLLEYPHYTRPADFRGWTVPDVLLSGHHGRIDRWRKKEALRRTLTRRPDLIRNEPVDTEMRSLLKEVKEENREE